MGSPVKIHDALNASVASFTSYGSPRRSQLDQSVRKLFHSFGLPPPGNLCKSGSTDALWFSTKFEKKMAALDDLPSSPLSRFQRDVPIRQSKLTGGPFRATQIWNQVIEHLKEKVELKKRRYKLKNYANCFTGTDAVDVVLHYLLSDQDTFCNLSREKAIKLCQTLMDKKVFQPVGVKPGETCKFEDSSGKVYHFIGDHDKENMAAIPSDSEDETEGRYDMCEPMLDEADQTPPDQISMESDYDRESYKPMTSELRSDITDSLLKRCRKTKRKMTDSSQKCDSSQKSYKRQKLCPSSSTESLEEQKHKSSEEIEDVWREVALCQLLTIVDVSFLDGVLDTKEEKEKSTKKVSKPLHSSGVVSNIVAKHWSLTCTANSESQTDSFMRAALDCIAHIPRGVSKFDTDFTRSCDSMTKLQAYNMIHEHYQTKIQPLFPERFLDLNLGIMKHVLAEHNTLALHAMQLNTILLNQRQKDELRRLLKFMSAAAEDNQLQLDKKNDNESLVLTHFTDSVVKHKGLAWNLASILVTFLMHHVDHIFTIPSDLKEKVDSRLQEIKEGQVPVVKETAFCSQVSVEEFQSQTEQCTNQSLIQMMNSIIDNSKLSLKEKKQKLRQFRKYHPHIFAKHFSGMV